MSDAIDLAAAPPPARHGAVQLLGDDRVAIRAERPAVFAALAAAGDWSQWWPGVRFHGATPPAHASRELGATAGHIASGPMDGTLEAVINPLKLVRVILRTRDVRHGLGWVWDVGGDVDATSEIWLEDVSGCTVVHHLVWPGTSRRAGLAPVLRRLMRQGLWSLKAHVQHMNRDRPAGTP